MPETDFVFSGLIIMANGQWKSPLVADTFVLKLSENIFGQLSELVFI